MKINIGWLIFFSLLSAFLVWVYLEYIKIPLQTVTIQKRKNYDIVTLKLPNSSDPDIFGSKYWESLHILMDTIPCSACRYEAVPFMKFFHDYVNKKTGKKMMYPENYEKWIKKLCNNKKNEE